MHTVAMDLTHVFFGVLLNLFSVQMTFGGTGDFVLDPSPQSYQMRYSSVPFIQAQFHPASGTIQQGILIPQERRAPGELYERMQFQDLMDPKERMVADGRLMPHESSFLPDHVMPQMETGDRQRMTFEQRNQGKAYFEEMDTQETSMNEQHLSPQQVSHFSEQQAESSNLKRQHDMRLHKTAPLVGIAHQKSLMSPENQGRMVPQDVMEPQENIQKIHHTSPATQSEQKHTQSDITEAHNGLRHAEEDLIRAVKGGYDYPTHTQTSYPQAPPYGYNPPNYSAPAAATPSYSSPATPPYSPPVHSEPATKFLKPDLSELIKPVTGKMAGKLNGLVGLVLSLLGSGKGLELTGIKELFIDGILKPIFVAKGGLKALISKLAIPVVALILINVEVLLTVWWLWEDCPAPVKHEVEYTKQPYPASYNY